VVRAGAAAGLCAALVACGSGGGGHPPAGGQGGGPPAQALANGAGAGGATQDTGSGGPPAGVGNGHVPAGAGAAGGAPGAASSSGTPDRNTNVIRPGKWKLTDLSGEIVATVSGACRPTKVAYDPDSAHQFGTLELTGDGRAQFHMSWQLAGTTPTATPTTTASDPPQYLDLSDPPHGESTWTQSGFTGQTPDGALALTATFDTPSMLVGRWTYHATSVGPCSGSAQGQGSWSAQPT